MFKSISMFYKNTIYCVHFKLSIICILFEFALLKFRLIAQVNKCPRITTKTAHIILILRI